MIHREDMLAQQGPFWENMRTALQEGVRDLQTGFDRVAYDWLDPRVEGGLSLGFAVTRALASFWRTPEGREPLAVLVMAGTLDGGALQVRSVPMDQWPELEAIHLAADGPVALTDRDALVRRMRVDDGQEGVEALFGPAALPGDLTLVSGLLGAESSSRLLARAAGLLGQGESGAAVLLLFRSNPGPVDIEDAGGPLRNGWHPGLSASRHMSDSHASASYLRIMGEEALEVWYNQAFRAQLFEALQPAAEAQGLTLTNRAFLDSLAEGSPLRRVLPQHLTRHFPEAERVFWCLPEGGLDGIDPIEWDPSSPFERLSLLSAQKVAGGYA